MADTPARSIELRLAVVCYGGVALAIYMHGVTKEFHKLVRASKALDDETLRNDLKDTEKVYFEALQAYQDGGTRLRVVVDVISGTSAGGINGVVLGKAIACKADQAALRDLWLESADLRKLLRPRVLPGLRPKIVIAAGWQLLRLNSRRSPLSGSFMSRELYRALAAMDTGTTGTLLTGKDSLDLYVTTTDLRGAQTPMPNESGGTSQTATDFAQALHFRANAEPGDFGVNSTPALAFAARATSSFPGAFAPVSLASFEAEASTRTRPVTINRDTVKFVKDHRESDTSLDSAWFVDGGLLDNAPFDHAVNAIARKRADSQVVRRLAYIEPDPRVPLGEPVKSIVGKTKAPRWIEGVLKSVLGAKGAHSFLPELVKIRDMNTQIAVIGAIAQAQEKMVQSALVDAGILSPDTHQVLAVSAAAEIPDVVVKAAEAMNEQLPGRVGTSHPTYVRLKAVAAIDYFCQAVAREQGYVEGSNAAAFLQSAAHQWVQQKYDWGLRDPVDLAKQLVFFDMPYRERRLHFVLAAINELYLDPAHPVAAADLDKLKSAAWDAHATIATKTARAVDSLAQRNLLDFLPEPNAHEFINAKRFAEKYEVEFTTIVNDFCGQIGGHPGAYSQQLWDEFAAATIAWPIDVQRSLVSRYLGFPLWDAMVYPIIALSNLPQYSPIDVDQFSPLTANALRPLSAQPPRGVRALVRKLRRRPPPTAGKLQGAGTFHFGGFFDRAWRENDYLWGRLDTVERLLGILADAAGSTGGPDYDPEGARIVSEPERAGITAVLAAESDLRKIKKLVEYIEVQIAEEDSQNRQPDISS